MRPYHFGLLAIGICLIGAVPLAAAQPKPNELISQLTSEHPAAGQTPEQIEAAYVQLLDIVMPDMGSDDVAVRARAQTTLERIAFNAGRPGTDTERAACSKAIAARIACKAEPVAQAWLIRQLERLGRGEAVPALARLLGDKDVLVRESARRALQKNPAADAGAALRQALGEADAAAWRVALINAIGQRAEAASLDVLLKEAAAENEDVRTAAVIGLAKLGDKSAVAPIAAAMNCGSSLAKRIAGDCYVRLANALAAKGDKPSALGIYRAMLVSRGHLKCAGIIGIGRTGSPSDLPVLLDASADPDVRVRGACVEAFCLMEGKEVADALLARVATAKPETKVVLLQVLARKGEKRTAATFLAAAVDADEAVQAAALAGLGTVGNVAAVPVLLKATSTSGSLQQAARESLQSLPGADVDKAIIAATEQQDANGRVEAIRLLAARHVVAATPLLLRAAGDADQTVRSESLKALGLVAPSSALAPLAASLAVAKDAARGDLVNALVSIAERDADVEGRTGPILKAMTAAEGPGRLALMTVLGRLGGQKSLEALRAALKDNDEKVKDGALRAMTEWPDATVASDLLALANTAANPTHQVLAMRGYLRVCSIKSKRPDAETARLLIVGLEAAKRPAEKKQAIGALAQVHGMVALRAVVPLMDDSALREEAASAAVRIGRDICSQDPATAKTVALRAIEVSRSEGIRREAKELIDKAEERIKELKPKK